MGRRPCCEKVGLKRGPWTVEEDNKLTNFILNNGIHCWRAVPKLAGLLRCGKSCRLRWVNYLRPDLKRGGFTDEEEDHIIQLHSYYGNRWSKIASHFPGRTDNEIKNYWNTRIRKKLKHMGLDLQTHSPIEKHHQNKEKNTKRLMHSASATDLVVEKGMQNSEAGCRERTTCMDDSETMWQSFDVEPIEMLGSDQPNASIDDMGTTFVNEDLQFWLDHLESMLFADSTDNHNDIS